MTKNLSLVFAAAAALLAVAPSAYSVGGFQDTFDTFGYTEGQLSGQNSWVTNDDFDGSNGGNDYVGPSIAGYSSPGDNAGQMGRIYGSAFANTANVTLTHGIAAFASDPFYQGFKFTTDFAITSSVAYSSKDAFGFTFKIGGTEYATLLFTPQNQTAYDGLGGANDKLDITISGPGFSTVTSPNSLIYNSLVGLSIDIDLAGNLQAAINGTNLFVTPVAVGTVPDGIDSVAVDWNIGPGGAGNPGDNSIVFDNVYAVPEPSTVGLSIIAGIGGMALMLRRRNKVA